MKNINKSTIYITLGALLLGILMGWLIFSNKTSEQIGKEAVKQSEQTIWTCSMHPQVRQSEPGQCPICGMDLIPLNNLSSSDENPMEIKMSPTAMQLANVQTAIIVKQKPVKEIRMNGKIKADERLVQSQTAHIPGRIEKLLVNYTGESINKGQVLAYIYSPDLVTAQEELFEALKIKKSQPLLFEAAKGKLQHWKLTEKQINNIIQRGQPQEQFPVLADVSGVVMNKRVNLGDYVQKGQSLFEVADLSKIWVLFDVYESDMQWIKKGDKATFTIQSLPGETFTGNISFIDPIINPRTRVATARIELVNRGEKFKPEMFATATIKSPINGVKEALIVPKSAVMWTGERSVVYVKKSAATGVNFIMREVTLGAALGSSFIVKEGLEEGEEIATNGTFSIDAAAQLAGKPSMMNPQGGQVMTGHNHAGTSERKDEVTTAHAQNISISKKTKEVLQLLIDDYLKMKDALVEDDFEKSKKLGATLLSNMNKINMGLFTGEAHNVWMKHSNVLAKALKPIEKSENIGDVRKHFKTASDQLVMLAVTFGPFDKELYVQQCPMANDNKGADWISGEKKIQNPYFGKSMIGCGDITKEIK